MGIVKGSQQAVLVNMHLKPSANFRVYTILSVVEMYRKK